MTRMALFVGMIAAVLALAAAPLVIDGGASYHIAVNVAMLAVSLGLLGWLLSAIVRAEPNPES